MGHANVGAVQMLWARLPHTPHRLLSRMALVSLDPGAVTGEPLVYFGGQGDLGMALGYVDSSEEPLTKKQRETIRLGLQYLSQAGAITCTQRGYGGRRSEYRLHILRAQPFHPQAESNAQACGQAAPALTLALATDPPVEGGLRPPGGGGSRPPGGRGSQTPRWKGAQRVRKGTEEDREEDSTSQHHHT